MLTNWENKKQNTKKTPNQQNKLIRMRHSIFKEEFIQSTKIRKITAYQQQYKVEGLCKTGNTKNKTTIVGLETAMTNFINKSE